MPSKVRAKHNGHLSKTIFIIISMNVGINGYNGYSGGGFAPGLAAGAFTGAAASQVM